MNEIRQKIEHILLQELPSAESAAGAPWLSQTFGELDCVEQKHLRPLLEPTRALLEQGGKRWRPLLLVLCAQMASADDRRIKNAFRLTPLLEFVHTASLIHDDIEDRATERRSKPCAYITYGLDTALNAASWLYFKAASCINSLDATDSEKKQFYDLYAMELRRLHLGQAMDIAWHNAPGYFPTAAEYSQMVRCKTGTLSALAAKAGFLAGGASSDDVTRAGNVAAQIGEGFQVLDDVQNLTTGNPGKKRGDDIVEGKKSLPVLLCVQKNPSSKEELSALFEQAAREGIESPAVEKAIGLLEQSGAIKEAFDYGNRIAREKALELTCILRDNKSGAREMINELFCAIQQ